MIKKNRLQQKKYLNKYSYKCSRCNYILTGWEYMMAKLDYGCPRCKFTFRGFNRIKTI